MMHRIIISYLIFATFFTACGLNFKRGNGNVEVREFEVEEFHKIYVGGNYNLTLIPADKNQVVIETDENLFRYINIESFDESLNINNVHKLKSTEGIFSKARTIVGT